MAAAKEHKDLSKDALTARLRDAGKGPIPFVFALSKGGKNHYLVLHKIKAGKSLLTFVCGKQKDANAAKSAYGMATLTPTGLVLDCEKVLPGMGAAAKVWVATNRHPKVKKIKVLEGGKEVAEEGEKGEEDGGEAAAVAEETRLLAETEAKIRDHAAKIATQEKQIAGLKKMAKGTSSAKWKAAFVGLSKKLSQDLGAAIKELTKMIRELEASDA